MDASIALTIGGPIFAWWDRGLPMAAAVLVSSFVLAFGLTSILRHYVQWLWILSMLALVVAFAYLVADKYVF